MGYSALQKGSYEASEGLSYIVLPDDKVSLDVFINDGLREIGHVNVSPVKQQGLPVVTQRYPLTSIQL